MSIHTTSPNRAYLALANAFAQIQPDGWTSDTLEPLGEILLGCLLDLDPNED